MSNTPNDPTTPNGQNVGDLNPPDDFGAEVAAIFAARETRAFDPNAPRADVEGGTPPGGPVAAMGNERDGDLVPPGGWPGGETLDATQAREPATAPGGDLPPPEGLPAPAADQVPAPAVDGQPGGGTAPAPPETPASGGAEPTSTPDPAADPATPDAIPAPVDGYVYTYTNDQGAEASIKFTNEQVERALSVAAWADALPEQTRVAMGAIEEGQAVAVPRADYDRYQAWLNQQQRTTRDADLANYDEDSAREIQRLRDELDSRQRPVQHPPAAVPANIDANLTATAQQYDAAARAFQTQHQLSQPELESLLDAVADAQIIAGLQQAHTQFNPVTGQVIRVDAEGAMTKALNAALTWNPQLHNAVITRQQAANSANNPSTPTTPAVPQPDPVTTKKAHAASLASAPSAAVPPAPRTTPLTGQEAVDAMARDLLAFMNK